MFIITTFLEQNNLEKKQWIGSLVVLHPDVVHAVGYEWAVIVSYYHAENLFGL